MKRSKSKHASIQCLALFTDLELEVSIINAENHALAACDWVWRTHSSAMTASDRLSQICGILAPDLCRWIPHKRYSAWLLDSCSLQVTGLGIILTSQRLSHWIMRSRHRAGFAWCAMTYVNYIWRPDVHTRKRSHDQKLWSTFIDPGSMHSVREMPDQDHCSLWTSPLQM